jgi:hypothetical protein
MCSVMAPLGAIRRLGAHAERADGDESGSSTGCSAIPECLLVKLRGHSA